MTWPQYQRGEVLHDGRMVKLRRRECDLLALLLMRRGDALGVHGLVGMIWPDPDDEPERAERAIYVGLHGVRRMLPGAVEMIGMPSGGRFRGLGYRVPHR